MAIKEVLRLVVEADTRGAVKGVEDFGNRSERAVSKSEKALDRWGNRLTSIGAGMIGFGAVAIAGLASTADAASDLGEVMSKNTVVFDDSAKKVEEFAEGAAKIGQSKRGALEAATGFGNLFTSMGLAADRSADMSIELTKLASDLASFSNTSPEEAIEALTSALIGEAEPIRKYGVLLDDATLRQQALDMGLTTTTTQTLPPAIKAQAAYAAILEQTTNAQGDFGRTSDSAANQQRVLAANFENLKASIGQGVLPAMTSLLNVANDVIGGLQGINSVSDGTVGQLATFASVGLVAAGGISVVAGQVMTMHQNLGQLATGVRSFTGRIGGLKGALGLGAGLAGAFFVVTEAMQGFNRQKEEAERLSKLYADALFKEGQAQRDALDEITATDESLDSIRRTLRESDSDVDVFQEAIESSGDELGRMQELMATTPRVQHQIEDAFRDAADGGSELAAELLRVIENGDAYGNSTRDLIADLLDQQDAFREGEEIALDYAHANGGAKVATEALSKSMEDQGEATSDAEDALKEYQDTLRGMFDPLFGLQDALRGNEEAQRGVVEAQAALDEVMADSESTLADVAAAQRDVEDAMLGVESSALDVTTAAADLNAAVADNPALFDDALNALQTWRDQGIIPTDEQLRFLQDQIRQTALQGAALDKVDPHMNVRETGSRRTRTELRTVRDAAFNIPSGRNTHVTSTGTSRALGELERIAQAINAISNTNVHVSSPVHGGGGLTLHEGGIVPGPRGQELLAVVQSGEEMLALDDPRHSANLGKMLTTSIAAPSFVSGGSASATYIDQRQFNVHTGADPQGVVEALKRYERSNGPIPVTVR